MLFIRKALKWLLTQIKINISLDIYIFINGDWERITHKQLKDYQKPKIKGLHDDIKKIAFVENGKSIYHENTIVRDFSNKESIFKS